MEIAQGVVASWIYDFSDYEQMYDLTDRDLQARILDFSAGIASFNAEAKKRGLHVISCDTSYQLSVEKMQLHAKQLLQEIVLNLKNNPARLRVSSAENVQNVTNLWTKTETLFLADYEEGKLEKRYQSMQLPKLPFAAHAFDLALCTDFIFHHLFSTQNIAIIVEELCRVSEEVRIFPLLDNQGKMSQELGPLMLLLQQKNYGVEVRQVPYQTLQGGNAMLRIWQQECHL